MGMQMITTDVLKSATVTSDGELTITLADGTLVNAGIVKGLPGVNAVPADEAVASYVRDATAQSHQAVAGVLAANPEVVTAAAELAQSDAGLLTHSDMTPAGNAIAFGVQDSTGKMGLALFEDGTTMFRPHEAAMLDRMGSRPGLHFVSASGASSELAIGSDGRFEPWVKAEFQARADVRQFLAPGQTMPSVSEDAQPLIQSAVDSLAVKAAADGRARILFLPPRTYTLAKKITWRSRVGLASTGSTECCIIAPPDASAVEGQWLNGGAEDYEDCVFEGFSIDGSLQNAASYTTGIKGIFIRNMRRARFTDVRILNVWATGFGVDQLDGAVFDRCAAIGCGRGIAALGLNPATSSGHSGFGLGTGKTASEPVIMIACEARDNGLYGFFTEKQSQYPNYPQGFRLVGCYASGNWVGFKDCGSTGAVVSGCQFVDNTTGIALAPTVLAPKGGTHGLIYSTVITGGELGVHITSGDGYSVNGLEVSGATQQGVLIDGALARLSVQHNTIHDCGGSAIEATAGFDTPDISFNRGWGNGGGLVLSGGGTTTAPRFVYNDLDYVSDHIIDDTTRIIHF